MFSVISYNKLNSSLYLLTQYSWKNDNLYSAQKICEQ